MLLLSFVHAVIEEEKDIIQNTNNSTIPSNAYDEQDNDLSYFYDNPQYALIYPWFIQVLGVIVFFALHQYEIPVPYAAVMFSAGMLMGVAAFRLEGNLEQFHASIRQWSDIDSQVLLLVFLPGLIFRDAIDINVPVFAKCLGQLLVLAFPSVLVGTVLTAAAVVNVLPLDLTWSLGLTLGAILASTDPVAVASVLKAADAPPRLQMHLGGESMLNDGAAVVFYLIFSQQFLAELGIFDDDSTSGTLTIGQGIATFFRMSLGGVAVGLLFAAGLLVLLYELDRRLDREFNVLQVAAAVSIAYLSYYTSEQVCGMSGVVACVTCGITAKALGKGLITDPDLMDSYLKLLEHLLNTLLFTLGGTVFGEIIANSDERAHFTSVEWYSLFILYAFVMIIRGIQVILCYPILSRIGLKTNWQESVFLGFAGLRGAVGIALALSLDRTVREESTDENKRAITSTVVGLAGGVSFLTLILNGTLAGWVLTKLGLTPPVTSRKRALRLFESTARDYILHSFAKLRHEQTRFSMVNFTFVQDHVPFLSGVPAEEFSTNLEQNTTSQFFQIHRRNSRHGGINDGDEEKGGGGGGGRHHRKSSSFSPLQSPGLRDDIEQTVAASRELASTLQNEPCPEEIKTDIRKIFLKILDAVYRAELSRGGLDSREDNGFLAEVLHQSVVFAVDDCHHCQEPLHDWEYTNMFTFYQGAEDYVRRFLKWMFSNHPRATTGSTREYLNLRIRVLRALVFVEAHRRAELELRSYLDTIGEHMTANESTGMTGVHVETAIWAVLEESKAQVLEAEEWLASVPSEKDLQCIKAHYMVTILLHKLGIYIENSVKDGRLKEKEGRLYLTQVEKRINNVHECDRMHEPRRRRRIKQLSSATAASSKSK